MKDDLDRTGMKKEIKTAKKLHALECGPDALPGSVRLVRVLDRWRNDWVSLFQRSFSREVPLYVHSCSNCADSRSRSSDMTYFDNYCNKTFCRVM